MRLAGQEHSQGGETPSNQKRQGKEGRVVYWSSQPKTRAEVGALLAFSAHLGQRPELSKQPPTTKHDK